MIALAMAAVLCSYVGCLILTIIFVRYLYHLIRNDGNVSPIPNWAPMLGLHPSILANLHRFHDQLTDIHRRNNGTFFIKGLCFTSDYLVTSDLDNVRYVSSKDNSTYLKGSDWLKLFDIFGVAAFNSDGDAWRPLRKSFHAFLNHHKLHQLAAKLIPNRVEEGLVQVLEHVADRGGDMVVDLQDLFIRHTFDLALVMGAGIHDPRLLSLHFPEKQFSNALNDAWEAAFYRYMFPECIWKLQSWLGIGREKRRSNAWKALDHLLAEYIATQREKLAMGQSNADDQEEEEDFNFLKSYLMESSDDINLIKDNLTHFLLAASDTNSTALTWFFYLLSNNPSVVAKIRQELKTNLSFKQVGNHLQLPSSINTEQHKLVYLHAALSETLRLYPPIPFEMRTCTQGDILPSGHRVNPSTRVVIDIYAMGRMSWIWGEDCNEFKPERWITEEGKIKREPPSKFPAFFAGPRICLGKDLSFSIMKATAATMIHNYDVHVLQGQVVTPKNSIFLRMKHGLKVRVKNRFN